MPKYQVFVSSTYEDLKTERDAVIKALLKMGHFPVGMEMFSAADATQWDIIKKQIETSDYYIVILAHRYGSMESGISYTEKEYDYAVATKIPVLRFVIHETAAWPGDLVDTDPVKVKKLGEFKKKLRNRQIDRWHTSKDLEFLTSVALTKVIESEPRVGYVRGSEVLSVLGSV